MNSDAISRTSSSSNDADTITSLATAVTPGPTSAADDGLNAIRSAMQQSYFQQTIKLNDQVN